LLLAKQSHLQQQRHTSSLQHTDRINQFIATYMNAKKM